MPANQHWLSGTSFLPLFSEAIEGTERLLADRLDRRGELDRPEDVLTTVLIETLQTKLDTVNGSLRDRSTVAKAPRPRSWASTGLEVPDSRGMPAWPGEGAQARFPLASPRWAR